MSTGVSEIGNIWLPLDMNYTPGSNFITPFFNTQITSEMY